MTAWMRYRGMPRRTIVEMSAAMPILAVALLGLGWIGAIAMSSLALAEHALMMPAMRVPVLLDPRLYAMAAVTGGADPRDGREDSPIDERVETLPVARTAGEGRREHSGEPGGRQRIHAAT